MCPSGTGSVAYWSKTHQDDFEVLEDAVPQRIAFLSSDVPLTPGLIVDEGRRIISQQQTADLRCSFRMSWPKGPYFMLCFATICAW
jgi:hypothetical protein